MKKRILNMLLMCCMVLTMLPATVFAAGEAARPAATQFTYTLHYDANGGSGAPPSQSVTSSELSVWIPISDKIPTRDGYTFKGWADSPNREPMYLREDGYYWNCLVVHGTSMSKTIYAIWEVHNHSWGEWTSNGNGTHTHTCATDSSHTETGNCSGGKATFTERAVCETCHTAYGELLQPTQALASVNITFPAPEAGKAVGDGSAASANPDSGLTLYLFGPALWQQDGNHQKLKADDTYQKGNTYLLNFTFYTQKPITDETVLTYNGNPITRYTDYQALNEALEAYDGTQDAYLGFVMFSEEGTGDPSMEDLTNLYIVGLYALVRVPEAQTPEDTVEEQFTLTTGDTYYFDLSAMGIPGTANGSLPDKTMHYVPFTYAGTVDAYNLTSEMATTEEYAEQNKYDHSLFIADYTVTHMVSWDDLNAADLIFGKDYAVGGVDYTLRAPSAGSSSTGPSYSIHGAPQSNEWDRILDKDERYIQNIVGLYSWGQDTPSASASQRVGRGYYPLRGWSSAPASYQTADAGFRPVLEVLGLDKLGPDGLKAVTLDLGGGKLGNSSEDIQIIVKSGKSFAAPASDGLTRPDGNTGSYFMWLGNDGNLYTPGDSVPADVIKLTAQFAYMEQFDLAPGGTYYFDLSDENIPGTANDALPDTSLHYVPFTYAGTADAYKLTSAMATTEEYAQQEKYPHSLFIADYAVTHTVSWDALNAKGLIFGKDYAAGGVDYTLRAPSVGSSYTGSGDLERGTPKSNEWDTMLNKNSGYIQNWNKMYLWGQDTVSGDASYRARRGYSSARYWYSNSATGSNSSLGFRPVLEVPNPDTLGSDGLKVVTLDLGGGKLGGSSDAIHIIVKNGSTFTAPMSGGLTRPDGDTGSYFMWLDGNGNSYAPGASVPADVTELTVQWTAPTYAVTLNTNGGTINSGNVTAYTYGVGATLPTDVTRTGYTFKGWYDNEGLTGNPVTAIGNTETGNKEYWAKWEINQYTVTVKPENGKADITITQDYGTPITAPPLTREGYQFNGWDKTFPTTMPAEDLTITAQWTVNQYTITYDLAGGTAEGNPDTYTIETGAFTLKNPTKSGYTFTGWSGTGLDGEKNMTVTIPTGSTGNRTYTAHWRYNGSGHSYSYYTIKAVAGAGGSISPTGNVSVREGRDQTFTITPDKGYTVSNVKIDGNSIGAVKSYTFENVSKAHTIEVIFVKDNTPQTGVFVDVAAGSYYEDAVDWAAANGITKGTGDTTFSPDAACTRAQAVTFLWRAAGSPEPETRTMPFTDVSADSYYYDAVLWAVENGITKGTSHTTFSPDATCTRAQAVTFLWRSEKSPASDTVNPFADVKSTDYYADAVLWAVQEKITKGTGNTTFSPNADCTRAQIVTFLWRCKK